MYNYKTTNTVSAVFLSLVLAACGGGENTAIDRSNPASSSGISSGSNSSVVDTTSPSKIGSGSGANFQRGVIGVTNDITELSAGGSTTLTVYIVSSTNTPIAEPIDISFISDCVAANKAILKDSGGEVTNSVSTINGRATVSYTANGCVGDDTITASASIGGTTQYAQVTLSVEAGVVGSIQFTDANPKTISLKGSGGVENSVVRFRVLDGNGAPVEKATVLFTMTTTSGDVTLTPASALSDGEGYVTTTINAGTVATTVSVSATIEGTKISTSSGSLTISTGAPVQNNASLALTKFNPRGADRDGEPVTVTMSMADDFNNPVPDDTAVSFWAEGGLIGSSCRTVNGSCSVTWKSQDFRPDDLRVTILAFASGNETFVDDDSDGRYDIGENFSDLGEAYRDDNEDGTYNMGEKFVDLADPALNNLPNGVRDTGNSVYNGTLCALDDTSTCNKAKITVRKSAVLSMSAPTAVFQLFSDKSCSIASTGDITGASGIVYVLASDEYGNSLPAETTVETLDSDAINMVVSEFSSTVPNQPNPWCIRLFVGGVVGESGSFQIQSTTEDNEESIDSFTIKFQP